MSDFKNKIERFTFDFKGKWTFHVSIHVIKKYGKIVKIRGFVVWELAGPK